MNFDRQALAEQAADLAIQGVYIGTSSWKYPGWCGTLYDRARYEYRGKFTEKTFCRLAGCHATDQSDNPLASGGRCETSSFG
jgi:hypothetical protein